MNKPLVSIVIPYLKEQEPVKVLEYFRQYQDTETVTDDTEGISRARNNCIEKAKGETIIFLDSDCFPVSNDWLYKMIEWMKTKSELVEERNI